LDERNFLYGNQNRSTGFGVDERNLIFSFGTGTESFEIDIESFSPINFWIQSVATLWVNT